MHINYLYVLRKSNLESRWTAFYPSLPIVYVKNCFKVQHCIMYIKINKYIGCYEIRCTDPFGQAYTFEKPRKKA